MLDFENKISYNKLDGKVKTKVGIVPDNWLVERYLLSSL